MTDPVIVQGIGVAAMIAGIAVYQTNTRKSMLLLGMTASLLWSGHFLLLGAITGCAMNLISVSRCFIYFRTKPTKYNRWILYSFAAVTTLATLVTWQGLISLLPLLGSMAGVFGDWQRKPKYIRRLNLLAPPPWFVYNLISGSYPGMIVEILRTTSNVIGQYRFDFRRRSRSRQLRFAFFMKQ